MWKIFEKVRLWSTSYSFCSSSYLDLSSEFWLRIFGWHEASGFQDWNFSKFKQTCEYLTRDMICHLAILQEGDFGTSDFLKIIVNPNLGFFLSRIWPNQLKTRKLELFSKEIWISFTWEILWPVVFKPYLGQGIFERL